MCGYRGSDPSAQGTNLKEKYNVTSTTTMYTET